MTKKKLNFGTDIQFSNYHKGEGIGIKYEWIASAQYNSPETIFLNKNKYWFEIGDKRMVRVLRHVFSHEPIHNILNHVIFDSPMFESYDRLRLKFSKQIKKECPKTFREWNTF